MRNISLTTPPHSGIPSPPALYLNTDPDPFSDSLLLVWTLLLHLSHIQILDHTHPQTMNSSSRSSTICPFSSCFNTTLSSRLSSFQLHLLLAPNKAPNVRNNTLHTVWYKEYSHSFKSSPHHYLSSSFTSLSNPSIFFESLTFNMIQNNMGNLNTKWRQYSKNTKTNQWYKSK